MQKALFILKKNRSAVLLTTNTITKVCCWLVRCKLLVTLIISRHICQFVRNFDAKYLGN